MSLQRVYIEYRSAGVLADAYLVQLASEDGSYGIKKLTGEIVVASGTTAEHPSTGLYEYPFDFEANVVYKASWKIIPQVGDTPRYVVQEIGPFHDSADTIRALADFRGSFTQNTTATLFLRITELDGGPKDAETITISILDRDGNTVSSGTPEKVELGFYAYDWSVPFNQTRGDYTVKWSYTVDDNDRTELQSIIVAADAVDTLLYSGRVAEFRAALAILIHAVQSIPVYSEPAMPSADYKKYKFTFDKWNQSPGCRIYCNGQIVTGGITINYTKGEVSFDSALTEYDVIVSDYNFRWFSDEDLDRFLSNGIHKLNIFPPVTKRTLNNVDDIYIPIVLYGAVVDAIRHVLLDLIVQQPQLVFGGPEAASKAAGQLESLKKNYEETWNKLLEQKKLGPYKGLTRLITTPPFALPGGRSRWFRYLFSGGSG
jgi:hypothetical protein